MKNGVSDAIYASITALSREQTKRIWHGRLKILLHDLYGTDVISERHRHRYEFNNDYKEAISRKGLVVSGISPDGELVEAVELPDKRFFIGVQFHPEFKSRPNRPHPLFVGLVRAAMGI